MNIYGGTLSSEKRQYNDKVANLLFPARSDLKPTV
jgi:hypothetical protein